MRGVEVRTTLEGFRHQWDELVDLADPPSAQYRSWWLEALQLPTTCYVCVLDSDRLLGGLALDIRFNQRSVPIFQLSGLFYLGTVHADLLAAADAREEVERRLAKWFRSHRNGVVLFEGVKAGGRLPHVLPTKPATTLFDEAPYISIEGSFDSYLGRRTSNFRSNLRRNQRRLEDAGYTYHVLAPDETDHGLEQLYLLHDQRHGTDSQFTPLFDTFARIARAGVAAGEISFHVLARPDAVIAIDAVSEINGYAEYLQGGRITDDPAVQGAGTVLLTRIVQYCYEKGFRELDLSVSADPYKLRFTDRVRQVEEVRSAWGWSPVWLPRIRKVRATFAKRLPIGRR